MLDHVEIALAPIDVHLACLKRRSARELLATLPTPPACAVPPWGPCWAVVFGRRHPRARGDQFTRRLRAIRAAERVSGLSDARQDDYGMVVNPIPEFARTH